MAEKRTFAATNSAHRLERNSLEKYIEQLPSNVDFKLQDWFETLHIAQLKHMEEDATRCCCYGDLGVSNGTSSSDLIEIASMAYSAEGCCDEGLEQSVDFIHSLLIGLAVAVCIERLKRAGWVVVTGQMAIMLQDLRPYRVTQKGVEEGIWSAEPLTLWILGIPLWLH